MRTRNSLTTGTGWENMYLSGKNERLCGAWVLGEEDESEHFVFVLWFRRGKRTLGFCSAVKLKRVWNERRNNTLLELGLGCRGMQKGSKKKAGYQARPFSLPASIFLRFLFPRWRRRRGIDETRKRTRRKHIDGIVFFANFWSFLLMLDIVETYVRRTEGLLFISVQGFFYQTLFGVWMVWEFFEKKEAFGGL